MALQVKGQCAGYSTTALVASAVINAQGSWLFHVHGVNTNAGTRYIQFFDSATVPANGAVPAVVIPAATGAEFTLDLGEIGRWFGNGLSWCNSSTLATKTIGAADTWLEVLHLPRQ